MISKILTMPPRIQRLCDQLLRCNVCGKSIDLGHFAQHVMQAHGELRQRCVDGGIKSGRKIIKFSRRDY